MYIFIYIYTYYLRQVHQYPYCWELRDHEVLKIERSGGFKYFLFSPLLGEMIQFDEHIFQMG